VSRAFVNEDADADQEPTYSLPERDSEYYDEAAAWALLEGANSGYTRGAETATGYRWGEPTILPLVQAILDDAERSGQDRVAQLARRYLKAAVRIRQADEGG
jgi:hypothetical protein